MSDLGTELYGVDGEAVTACRQFVFGRCHAEALGIVVPAWVQCIEWNRPPMSWAVPDWALCESCGHDMRKDDAPHDGRTGHTSERCVERLVVRLREAVALGDAMCADSAELAHVRRLLDERDWEEDGSVAERVKRLLESK